MELKKFFDKEVDIEFDIKGVKIKGRYKPLNWDLDSVLEYEKILMDNEKRFNIKKRDSQAFFVSKLLVSWDITEDGKPVEIYESTIQKKLTPFVIEQMSIQLNKDLIGELPEEVKKA